ncbi:7-cyano-7-deazaguanine synthase QueC [Rubinisphaera margarita]|uniref:7-cyano-7-deazaguanine synthase QueC n=1 Tax=Rubinisphaera margarita TaxID=2909586 RepID=UPI001EE8FC7D|nr:7-cyano-7-deazaguanine synthase QueC [Rubinisphaera margarita]MCG6157726.1 7-cyano-7-deazaguanine synthase QueC [Rubinisphaera margarita]
MQRAIVLLSGGLDSATSLAVAVSQGFEPYAISFRYGQRHESEIEAAQKIASSNGVKKHRIFELGQDMFGDSALTSNTPVPVRRTVEEMGAGIPATYVPARNTVFLSLALAFAESVGAFDIFVGVNALDYAGYPDCRPEYIEAFERMANLATKATSEGQGRIKIHAPLISLTKSEIIRLGLTLGVDYSLTSSCYSPTDSGAACGVCDACTLRLVGFAENGVQDPVQYSDQGQLTT